MKHFSANVNKFSQLFIDFRTKFDFQIFTSEVKKNHLSFEPKHKTKIIGVKNAIFNQNSTIFGIYQSSKF